MRDGEQRIRIKAAAAPRAAMMMRELLRRVERLESSAEASAEERALKELTELYNEKWREHDVLDRKLRSPADDTKWRIPENRNLPRFQDVFDNFTTNAAGAKGLYTNIRLDITKHETEKREARLKMEQLALEVEHLKARVKEQQEVVRLLERADALAPHLQTYGSLSADELQNKARAVHKAFRKVKDTIVGYSRHGNAEIDDEKADKLRTEREAIVFLLLTKYNTATTYDDNNNNVINFAPRSATTP